MAYANGTPQTEPAPDPQPETVTRGGGTSTIWPQGGAE